MHISVLLLATLAASISASPVKAKRQTAFSGGLEDSARSVGDQRFVGVSTGLSSSEDEQYLAILGNSSEFGVLSSLMAMSWETIEPTEGNFNFTQADALLNFAASHNQTIRCSSLVTPESLPTWLQDKKADNATLVQILENHITKVVTHMKGKCAQWEVLSQALESDGTYSRNLFMATIGPAYVPIAYRAAAAADPTAMLYYGDVGISTPGDKTVGVTNLISDIRQSGGTIEGVGIQTDFGLGHVDLNGLIVNLQTFNGNQVNITYTNVAVELPGDQTDDTDKQQAEDYQNISTACLNGRGCVGIILASIADTVGSKFGDLWNDKYQKKPAYTAFQKPFVDQGFYSSQEPGDISGE